LKNISGVDLNLMTAFEAMMVERHVSRAAQRVGLAQPSMSNALARLRALFDDPLFVRSPSGMQPTEKAIAIAQLISSALDSLRVAINEGGTFHPVQSTQTFRLATTDYGEMLIVPELLKRLRIQAPGTRLLSLPFDRSTLEGQLERGQIDVGLSVLGRMSHRVRTEKQFDERFVCVARSDHPALSSRVGIDPFIALDLQTFTQLDHVLVSRDGAPSGSVDQALAAVGRNRHVVATVANFTALIHLVAKSNMVASVGERIAVQMSKLLGLSVHALPLEVRGFTMSMAWHQMTDADAGQCWFRDLLREACADIATGSQGRRTLL
jgi:DNA-binding transcriptional LysR family regulator